MPSVASRCHELRIQDGEKSWRLIYRIDLDAIVIVDVFSKKTGKTPNAIMGRCRKRLRSYDAIS